MGMEHYRSIKIAHLYQPGGPWMSGLRQKYLEIELFCLTEFTQILDWKIWEC